MVATYIGPALVEQDRANTRELAKAAQSMWEIEGTLGTRGNILFNSSIAHLCFVIRACSFLRL